MQDRVPLYPGRVTLTPVEGQANTYDMVRADQPTQTGTPLSKANLLKDLTAAQFGLDGTAVPDDVLSWIGKYNEHWWSLLHGEAYSYTEYVESKNAISGSQNYNFTIWTEDISTSIYYSKSVSVDKNTGAITMVDPQPLSRPSASTAKYREAAQAIVDLAPCYISGVKNYKTEWPNPFYIPEGATLGTGTSDTICLDFDDTYYVFLGYSESSNPKLQATYVQATAQIIQVPAGATTYEHSTDRNAYPDSGTVDDIVYTYLGCPFEKMPRIANIMTGVYAGTGVGGSTSPNIINTPFAAKMIFIKNSSATIGATSVLATDTYPTGVYYGSIRSNDGSSYQTSYNTFTFSSNYVSWYLSSSSMSLSYFTTESKATAQLNTANTTYMYIIIG